jgi:UDP-glucose 4-epimerase
MSGQRILVTGAGGYLGSHLVSALAQRLANGEIATVLATDVRDTPAGARLPGVLYERVDIRAPGMANLLTTHAIDTVVHLASIVTPGKKSDRSFEYSVDVEGTQQVLDACVQAGVGHIIISSSGAAYGYHADNAAWLTETDAIRGNYAFAYSWHKRLVEEMLATYRTTNPQLKQTIFRIGTILGVQVKNQITDLFEKPRLIAIRGADSPFVFIWDQDVVGVLLAAIRTGRAGIFNVAGDGALTIRAIAAKLDKPVLNLPAWLLRTALALLKKLGLTQYGPEQLDFLRYRPVLDNRRLKEDFGYVPDKTSEQVFVFWMQTRKQANAAKGPKA